MKSVLEKSTDRSTNNTRKFALVAGCIILFNKLTSYLILSSRRSHSFDLDVCLNFQSVVFCWFLPIFMVLVVEKRPVGTLGLTPGRIRIFFYVILLTIFILLPLVYLGSDRSLLDKVFEQILFIAFAEEVLWRGYFQRRLSDWIGTHTGIFLASLLFGIGHVVSMYAIEGYLVPGDSIVTFVETTIGGLLFGYVYDWSRSIWLGAILHLFGNVFLFRIFT